MSSSRYPRSGSPPGRRFADPARTSTGALYSAYDAPPSSYSRHRETVTSPRSSGERVIPVSVERYGPNGERVGAPPPRPAYDAYDSRSRRLTHDPESLRNTPTSSSPASGYSRSALVHQQPDYRSRGPAGSSSGSSNYDNSTYISSNSSASTTPRREHKKVYSVDEDNQLRLQGDPVSRGGPPGGRGRTTDYHSSGPRRPVNLDDKDAYEYTDARGMYRDTEPRWRPRQHSIDGSRRERPSSMIDAYQADPRRSARDLGGPPPSTRGLDRINASNNNGVSRHGSLSGPQRSPPRHHNRRNSTDYYSDQDENYKVAPRIAPSERSMVPYDAPPERRDALGPPRDDRREPRQTARRFQDVEVASRGFGIRAPSAEPPREHRSSREESIDRHSAYSAEPSRKAAPAPRDVDYAASEPPRSYEPRDREPPRPKRDSPPRERDLPPRERDAPPRDKERERRDFEEPRRDRDYARDREYDRRDERRDEDRRPQDRRPERDYDDDRKERERHRDDASAHSSVGVGGAAAGVAAAGAAAYGAKELYDRHHHDDRASDHDNREPARESQRDKRDSPKQAAPGAPEPRQEDRARPERGHDDKDRGRVADGSPEDVERPRRRHYARERSSDEIDVTSEARSKESEAVDPEEDYRRRVQQEAERAHAEEHYREPQTPRREPAESRRDGHESGSETGKESTMALTPYKSPSDDASQGSGEDNESFQERRKRRVSIVEPAKAISAPKSILRKPTEKFPEDPNPIREGVAPLKDAKNKDAPPTARWTKINRSMVNPEALEEAQERYEERQDHVIVLRVLTRDEIQKYADRTKEIREGRYDKGHRRHRRDRDGEHERDEEHDRDRHRDRDRERDSHRERDDKKEKAPGLEDMLTGIVTGVLEQTTKHK